MAHRLIEDKIVRGEFEKLKAVKAGGKDITGRHDGMHRCFYVIAGLQSQRYPFEYVKKQAEQILRQHTTYFEKYGSSFDYECERSWNIGLLKPLDFNGEWSVNEAVEHNAKATDTVDI